MKQQEKEEIAKIIDSFNVLHQNIKTRHANYSDLPTKTIIFEMNEIITDAHEYLDNIEPEDVPHNFTPDVVEKEAHIDNKSNRLSRLKLAHYSLSSLLVDVLDGLADVIPHKQKLKQVISTYTKMLEDETKVGYSLAKDKELHFSQWQNLIKLGNDIFIKSIIDGKAHDFLSFLIAFDNDACKYEITDAQFDKEDVDAQAGLELLVRELKEKSKNLNNK